MIAAIARTAFVHLALAAMLVRALVPVGWMPGITPAHTAALVVCPMQTSGGMIMDHRMTMDHGMAMESGDRAPLKIPGKDRHQHQVPCPFAMSSHWVPPTNGAVIGPSELMVDRGKHRAIRLTLAARPRLPQNPRAPPILA